jgi:hypothetical protein
MSSSERSSNELAIVAVDVLGGIKGKKQWQAEKPGVLENKATWVVLQCVYRLDGDNDMVWDESGGCRLPRCWLS